ncbi:MAG: hypothetical protein B6I23_00750 [Rickettsiaceae bacterium 4572_127]|nr:MAG: hypothetical protein B6I23_00750 [Rickettsiaceae bacterium 4572_127]
MVLLNPSPLFSSGFFYERNLIDLPRPKIVRTILTLPQGVGDTVENTEKKERKKDKIRKDSIQ